MLCRRGPRGRGSGGGQWNGDLGRREPCTKWAGKSHPGGMLWCRRGSGKVHGHQPGGSWPKSLSFSATVPAFWVCTSLLELSTTTLKAIFFTRKSPCKFPRINFKTVHAVRSLIKEAMFEMPFPWTQRMGVQWGMEPFRKIRGKKLLKFRGELMLNFSGSRNF